jgi:hypothetical protein
LHRLLTAFFSEGRSIEMRCSRSWHIGVGLLVALSCFSLPWGRAPQAEEDSLGCSLETLQGTYIYAYGGFEIEDGKRSPAAFAGQEVYYGDGTMSGVYSASLNGTIAQNIPYTGTYTLNEDCTGNLTTTDEFGTFHYDHFVDPSGDGFSWVATDPGVVAAAFERRVSELTPPPRQTQ